MKYLQKPFITLWLFAALFVLAACDDSSTQHAEKTQTNPVIKVAVTEISAAILQPGLAWLKQQGVAVELVIMAGNVNVIRAVNDGSVDAALGVHIKFMENFNALNNGQLSMVEPYAFTTGIGLYSEKYNNLAELPNGASIAIMNDAMNMDRGLRLLQQAGLIELKKTASDNYSLIDISANPKQLKLIDMNQVQTVRALAELDGAIVFFTHMQNAGKDFKHYLVRDQDAANYPMGIVVLKKNLQTKWAPLLAQALLQPDVRANIAKQFAGVFEYYQ